MLLAEELALVAIDPESGRHPLGIRDQLNACLAGLLVAELVLDEKVREGEKKATVVLADGAAPASPLLGAAAGVIEEKGPKLKSILAHMSRGLNQRVGAGTWDAVVGELETKGVVRSERHGLRTRYEVIDRPVQDEVRARLRAAAAGDEPLDVRTALVLSMTGPANLLEVVAPDRGTRRHARRRIDHALDASELQPVGEVVRRVLAEAAAVVAIAATTAAVAAAGSG
jgi:hypothetical protein